MVPDQRRAEGVDFAAFTALDCECETQEEGRLNSFVSFVKEQTCQSIPSGFGRSETTHSHPKSSLGTTIPFFYSWGVIILDINWGHQQS